MRPENLPPGRYAVRVWHPRMQGADEPISRTVTIDKSGAVDVAWKLTTRPELHPRRAPVPGQRGYR